jgi:hypothetical protein
MKLVETPKNSLFLISLLALLKAIFALSPLAVLSLLLGLRSIKVDLKLVSTVFKEPNSVGA